MGNSWVAVEADMSHKADSDVKLVGRDTHALALTDGGA